MINWGKILTVCAIFLLGVTAQADQIDLTTAGTITQQAAETTNITASCELPSQFDIGAAGDFSGIVTDTRDYTILWDLTHGVYIDYSPDQNYSDLVTQLNNDGITVSTTDIGIDNADLTNVDVIVIALGSAWYSSYTQSEIDAIDDFVNDGGGLLILSDNSNCPNGNITGVAGAFDMTLYGYLEPNDLYITQFENHPIFDGISELNYLAAGAISVVSPAEVVAWHNADGVAAVEEYGNGRVVSISDINCFANNNFGNSNNAAFAANVFDWLINGGGSGADVIWDITHGVYMPSYLPDPGYTDMLDDILTYGGHTVETTDQGVENINLSDYDVAVISWGTAHDEGYSYSEVAALQQFVNNGGGLLVMGDNTDCPNEYINPVAQGFGVTCGVSYVNPLDLYVDDFEEHPVFDEVTEIYLRAAGELGVISPCQAIASSDGLPVVAAGYVGDGRVLVIGDANHWSNIHYGYSDNSQFAVNAFNWLAGGMTGIDNLFDAIPESFSLSQNYPNPFNASTTIEYAIDTESLVKLEVFDILGHKVALLQDGVQQAGQYRVTWNAEDVSSGIYFYRLTAGYRSSVNRMTLLK